MSNSNLPTPQLKRSLGVVDLVCLGIGTVIGSGIFIVTGIAAATKAGPAIVISFLVAGLASLLTALAYAELSSSIGGCGGAYNYAYKSFGKTIAWIIGWGLLFEYGVGAALLAIGWSGYMTSILNNLGISLPPALLHSPIEGGIINLPAILIVLFLCAILSLSVKKSARFNAVMVAIKLIVIGIFVAVASFHVKPSHWHPFLPFGWLGVMQGAALIFNAFIGFDVIALAAEETKNPKRNLPLGIIISFIVCMAIYLIFAALLTGIMPYFTLNNASPVSTALLSLHLPWVANIVGVGAAISITTVLLAFLYGLTRVFFAMSRDKLLPSGFASLSKKRHTPTKIVFLAAIIVSLLAGFVPLNEAVKLVNMSTLVAFILICLGIIVLRFRQPNLERSFKTPLIIPVLAIMLCTYLILNLSPDTWLRFGLWILLGIPVYFAYGRVQSRHVDPTIDQIEGA